VYLPTLSVANIILRDRQIKISVWNTGVM